MPNWIVSEGQKTDYGGRTVRLEYTTAIERAARQEWTPEEDGRLRWGRHKGFSYKQIARLLDRTPASVMARHVFLKREGSA